MVLVTAFLFPALFLFFWGETVGGIVQMYLVPVCLFLIGFPWVSRKAPTPRIAVMIYSVALGMALVGLTVFLISKFIHFSYARFLSIVVLFSMVIFGAFRLYRCKSALNFFDLSLMSDRLSHRYCFFAIIPVLFAVLHYSIYGVSFAKSPLKPLIVDRVGFATSHVEEGKVIYLNRFGDLTYHLGKSEIIDRNGLPIQNP